MTDEEREAMGWLESYAALDRTNVGRFAATLKAMLARPVMPEEPSQEIVTLMFEAWRKNGMCAAYYALYAHLSAPKTKEVEVWRVEYAEASPDGYIPGCETHDSAADAESAARNFRMSIPAYECVHVTGPHLQTVPA